MRITLTKVIIRQKSLVSLEIKLMRRFLYFVLQKFCAPRFLALPASPSLSPPLPAVTNRCYTILKIRNTYLCILWCTKERRAVALPLAMASLGWDRGVAI